MLDHFAQYDVLDGVSSVYSIGPGFGVLEVALMTRGIEVGYAEPYQQFAQELEQRAAAAGVHGRIVERHEGGFETARVERRYDLVLAVHSWGSLAGDRAALDAALGVCSASGKMVMVLADAASPLAEVFDVRRPSTGDARQVSAWLTDQGVAHDVRWLRNTIRREILLTSDDRLTESAIDLAAFKCSQLPDALSNDYLERIRSALVASPDELVNTSGLITVPHAS